MRYHHKKMNMICFDAADLKQLFEAPSRQRLVEEIAKAGYSPEELMRDETKRREVGNRFKIVNDKEDLEIFSALYLYLKFYPDGKICFKLKDSASPMGINSLATLKVSLKESDLTDFAFMSNEGIRTFQLKAYTGNTDANELFNFIKSKLTHYGNDIGEVNLLVPLRSKGAIAGPFFQELHDRIKTLNIKGTGHILISYNEEDKFSVINTLYPTLATTRIPYERLA